MHLLKKMLVFLVVCLLLIGMEESYAQNSKYGIENQIAPSWEVNEWNQLPDGRDTIDVDNFKGRVLYVYGFQSWCPGCHTYGFPTLQKLIKHYKGNPQVAFVAIQTTFEGFSFNTFEKAKATATKYNLQIPVGQSGEKGNPSAFMRKYRSGGTPWTVIIDKKGIVKYNDFHIKPDQATTIIDSLL